MAKILAGQGWDLVIVGRSTATLEKMRDELSSEHGVKVTVIEADLSQDGAVQVSETSVCSWRAISRDRRI